MMRKLDPELVERARAWRRYESVPGATIYPKWTDERAAEYAAEREREALERAAAEMSLRGWAAASHRIRSLIPKPEETA